MKPEELKVGMRVKAYFRRYGKHLVEGTITEISKPGDHAIPVSMTSLTNIAYIGNSPKGRAIMSGGWNLMLETRDVVAEVK